MTSRFAPALVAGALALVAAAPPAAFAQPGVVAPPTTLDFTGVPYLHRWSKAGQNEYTPLPQSDLANWRDMITLQVYEGATTPDRLADIANTVLVSYQKSGLVIRTNSLPATPGHPAQHMIVAVLADKGVREMVFVRFRMTPEAGEAIVYSHRIHGLKPDAEASAWLKANDLAIEKAMMTWSDIPSVPALRTLPQAP